MRREFPPTNTYIENRHQFGQSFPSATLISGGSLRPDYIMSPIRGSTPNQFTPRQFNELYRSPTRLSDILSKMATSTPSLRPSLHFPHAGVGEKGPASRRIADSLGTYESESIVAPLKTLLTAAAQHYGRKALIRTDKFAKALYKEIKGSLPGIPKEQFVYATKSPGKAFKTIENKLMRRGVNKFEIYNEINAAGKKGIIKNEHRPYISKLKRIRAYNEPVKRGMPESTNLATSIAYSEPKPDKFKYAVGAQITQQGAPKVRIDDPSPISRARQDLYNVGPSETLNVTFGNMQEPLVPAKLSSHVNIRLVDGSIDKTAIDKHMAGLIQHAHHTTT